MLTCGYNNLKATTGHVLETCLSLLFLIIVEKNLKQNPSARLKSKIILMLINRNIPLLQR